MLAKLIIAGLLIILSAGTGLWLTRLGRPLNTLVFTLHKLIAIAALIVTVVFITGLFKNIGPGGYREFSMILSGLFFLALFVTGGILSFDRPGTDLTRIVHRFLSILLVLTAALMFISISGKII